MASSYQTHFATGCVNSAKCCSQCSAEFSEVDTVDHISGKDLVHSNFFCSSEAEFTDGAF